VRIRITLAAGLALTAIAVFAVLQRSPLTVAATNGVHAVSELSVVGQATVLCQPGQVLPRYISAIRLSYGAITGPKVVVTVLSGKRVITGGTIGSGWYGSAVTVPVRPLLRAYSNVTVCAHFGALTGDVGVLGERSAPAIGDRGWVHGLLSVAYLRPGHRSWWSLAPAVIDHIALGRGASGTWIVFAIVALIASAILLASLTLTGELK
jgi:hypothetical protein